MDKFSGLILAQFRVNIFLSNGLGVFHSISKAIPTLVITEIRLPESVVIGHSFLLIKFICSESTLVKQFIIWFSIYKDTAQYVELSIPIGLMVKFLIINL